MNDQHNENGPTSRGNDFAGPGQPPHQKEVVVTDDTMTQATDNPQPTARQALELEQLVTEAQQRYGVEAPSWSATSYAWRTRWHHETRPGRGHDLSTTYIDGDHVIYISVDVYGSSSLSVGSIDWIHSTDNECYCTYCVLERTEPDEAV